MKINGVVGHGAHPPLRVPPRRAPTLHLFCESSAMACLIFSLFVAVAFGVVTLEEMPW